MFEKETHKIHKALDEYLAKGKSLCASSSFQPQSLPLLHILSTYKESIPVLFVDTGFHFAETYAYVADLQSNLGLDIKFLKPSIPKSNQLNDKGSFYYANDTDYCCFINKVQPLKEALKEYDVWLAGVRKDQTSFRAGLQDEVLLESGQLKFHPMLDWTSKMIYEYVQFYKLPSHPLLKEGYMSIGCQPCTLKLEEEMNREGRWYGSNKTECGIHTK